jgi:lipopolysaccharide/colanic/teichoic acid biosynthesis glycosyltransferase
MQMTASASGEREVPESWPTLKRWIDVVGGGLLLVISAPVVIVSALAIACVTGGTPFFPQERVGMHGRRFKMFKLRTMVNGAHALRHSVMNDPRLHPLGRFLRRTSIDELPNLVNVVLGDMSLVGPRPALPSEVEHYDATALRRLSVPQGVTCLWQINGRSEVSFEHWMDLDNRYVDSWTPLGDLLIIAKTVPAVLRRDGAH